MKILLVEDNEMNRDMLTRRLRRRGHVVLTAVDGREAIDTALTERPDVVLMDMGLPVMDGWEATRQFRGDPRIAAIPIIALTAHAMAEDRTRAMAAGCDDFDTKPVDMDRLCGKIAAVGRAADAAPVGSQGDPAVFHATQQQDLAGLAAFVDRSCRAVNADGDAAADIRLAVEEVFSNIVQHGYRGRPGPVTVRIDARPGRITVTITDQAPGFDPSSLRTPDLPANWERRSLGGLGWHLVHRVMDQVDRRPGAAGGNVYTLVKQLSAGDHGG